MKANELMIGDWVECVDSTRKKKVYAQIDAIEEGQTCILVRLDNCNWFLNISLIEPIPLTPEILEKNGFIKQDFEGWLYFKHKDDNENKESLYSILWRNDYYLPHLKIASFTSEYGGYSRLNIQYVHELQHALRLCGIDKEIEL